MPNTTRSKLRGIRPSLGLKAHKWYKLEGLDTASDIRFVLISKNVISLDIAWIYSDVDKKLDDLATIWEGSWQWDTVSYPYLDEYDTIEDWLADNVEDDAYESFFRDEDDFVPFEASNIGSSISNMPRITVRELQDALNGFKEFYISEGKAEELEEM